MASVSKIDAPDAVDWRSSSLWSERPASAKYGPVRTSQSVDVVVIGAGLAGLLTATLLARIGVDVIVVDRYDIGGVATRNTTAKVTALQGTTYSAITKARGGEVASMYAAAQLDAVAGIRQLAGELGIDCGLTEAPAYTYATELPAAEHAAEELRAASAAGLSVEWVTDAGLPFAIEGAVKLDGQHHIDPAMLCAGLAAGLGPDHVAANSAVAGVDETDKGCAVHLDSGFALTADHVVLATQAPIVDPALLANRCRPMQSYCIAARLAGAVPAGMYLSCDSSTRSLRPAHRVHDDGEIAVIAGAGHPMGTDDATPERWDTLASWAAEALGAVAVTHRWATHDLVPNDHVPFIGRLAARRQRSWVATGFAKWGMTNSYVAAHLISTAIGGGEVPWAAAFDPTRIAPNLNRELAGIGKTALKHLVGDRIARRDEPRCTHQGCVLRSDPALGTWDCPCHGSRFTDSGEVIQGPAKDRLQID